MRNGPMVSALGFLWYSECNRQVPCKLQGGKYTHNGFYPEGALAQPWLPNWSTLFRHCKMTWCCNDLPHIFSLAAQCHFRSQFPPQRFQGKHNETALFFSTSRRKGGHLPGHSQAYSCRLWHRCMRARTHPCPKPMPQPVGHTKVLCGGVGYLR